MNERTNWVCFAWIQTNKQTNAKEFTRSDPYECSDEWSSFGRGDDADLWLSRTCANNYPAYVNLTCFRDVQYSVQVSSSLPSSSNVSFRIQVRNTSAASLDSFRMHRSVQSWGISHILLNASRITASVCPSSYVSHVCVCVRERDACLLCHDACIRIHTHTHT